MNEKRRHQRINCAEKCFLYYSESTYCGAVMNISISGALINLYGSSPDTFIPGEMCSLLLSDNPESSLFRYKGRIAYSSPAGLGLEILKYEF